MHGSFPCGAFVPEWWPRSREMVHASAERPEGEPAFSEAEGGREQDGKLLEHPVAILPFSAAPLSTGEAASCFCLV